MVEGAFGRRSTASRCLRERQDSLWPIAGAYERDLGCIRKAMSWRIASCHQEAGTMASPKNEPRSSDDSIFDVLHYGPRRRPPNGPSAPAP